MWARVFRARIDPYRFRDILVLGLWQCPPWMIVGYLVYEWQIVNADLTRFWLALFAAAFTLVRLLGRLMQFYVMRGIPAQY